MKKEIKAYVKAWTQCQRMKPARHKSYGELESLPPPASPYTDISMDFITDLPPSKRRDGGKVYDSILVIMDRYTKMARYLPTRKDIKAEELADVIMNKHVLRGAGLPQSIVSDKGSVFNARYWSSLYYTLNVKRRLSIAYHPQTDGQTERQNFTLEQYMRAYVNYLQDDWTR